jgi:hypothetical protein
LSQGRIFYLTAGICPPWKKLKSVIEHAGGKVETGRRRTDRDINRLNMKSRDPIYLIISCQSDLHKLGDLLKTKICKVFNSEFVMDAVLNGKVNFELKSLTTK